MAKAKVVSTKPHAKAWEPDSRQLEMYAMRIRGRHSYQEIAKEFGVTQQAVHKQVSKVNDWLVPRHLAEISQMKVEHIERLMGMYREAMLAWDESKKDGVVRKKGVLGDSVVDTVETRGQVGDPRYLEQARKCLEDIRKIAGADAPIRIHSEKEVRLAGIERESARNQIFNRIMAMGNWGNN